MSLALAPLQRALPALAYPELERAVARPGAIQRAARHVARCRRCRQRGLAENVLCITGVTLVAKIPRRRRRRA